MQRGAHGSHQTIGKTAKLCRTTAQIECGSCIKPGRYESAFDQFENCEWSVPEVHMLGIREAALGHVDVTCKHLLALMIQKCWITADAETCTSS